MTADLARQIKKLSVAERIILVEEIWDGSAEENAVSVFQRRSVVGRNEG